MDVNQNGNFLDEGNEQGAANDAQAEALAEVERILAMYNANQLEGGAQGEEQLAEPIGNNNGVNNLVTVNGGIAENRESVADASIPTSNEVAFLIQRLRGIFQAQQNLNSDDDSDPGSGIDALLHNDLSRVSPTEQQRLRDRIGEDLTVLYPKHIIPYWTCHYLAKNKPRINCCSNEGINETQHRACEWKSNGWKPPSTFNIVAELTRRENNLTNRIGWRGGHTSALSLIHGYSSSRNAVESMEKLSGMSTHTSWVKSLSFNRSGDLICTGSKLSSIDIWNWAHRKPIQSIGLAHLSGVYDAKFIDNGTVDIVTTGRDGQVLRAIVPPSGGRAVTTECLYKHTAGANLVVVPLTGQELLSADQNGLVYHFDLRSNVVSTVVSKVAFTSHPYIQLFSIAHHPFAPEFCVSGANGNLLAYDRRQPTRPMHILKPGNLTRLPMTSVHSVVYNNNGNEILASYSDAGIYLFDNRNYQMGEYLKCFEGHVNFSKVRPVRFFGPRSEYIVSGSDCKHIFIWHKDCSYPVKIMEGDLIGCVNCVEPHPWLPIIASSSLEFNVKIWTASSWQVASNCPGPCQEPRSIFEEDNYDYY